MRTWMIAVFLAATVVGITGCPAPGGDKGAVGAAGGNGAGGTGGAGGAGGGGGTMGSAGGAGGAASPARVVAVPKGSPGYDRLEGPGYKNDCAGDSDCHRGGCASEICSADPSIMSACDIPPAPPPSGSSCGCVEHQCVWWLPAGTTSTTPATTGTPGADGAAAQQPCDDGKCQTGLTCVKYYGVAGPRGPQFTSCEVPCAEGTAVCPRGKKCTTIADGPGRVCR